MGYLQLWMRYLSDFLWTHSWDVGTLVTNNSKVLTWNSYISVLPGLNLFHLNTIVSLVGHLLRPLVLFDNAVMKQSFSLLYVGFRKYSQIKREIMYQSLGPIPFDDSQEMMIVRDKKRGNNNNFQYFPIPFGFPRHAVSLRAPTHLIINPFK